MSHSVYLSPSSRQFGLSRYDLKLTLKPAEAAAHGFPYFDDAFVAMSRTLAENMKKSLMNHPEVKLTVQLGGQHQSKYWSERFGPAVSFLFPPETEATK